MCSSRAWLESCSLLWLSAEAVSDQCKVGCLYQVLPPGLKEHGGKGGREDVIAGGWRGGAVKTNLLLKRKTKDKMSLGALLWRSMKCFTGSCLLFNCKHSVVRFLPIMGSFMQKLHHLWCSCNSLHLGGRSFLAFFIPLIWSFPCDFLIRVFFHVFFLPLPQFPLFLAFCS